VPIVSLLPMATSVASVVPARGSTAVPSDCERPGATMALVVPGKIAVPKLREMPPALVITALCAMNSPVPPTPVTAEPRPDIVAAVLGSVAVPVEPETPGATVLAFCATIAPDAAQVVVPTASRSATPTGNVPVARHDAEPALARIATAEASAPVPTHEGPRPEPMIAGFRAVRRPSVLCDDEMPVPSVSGGIVACSAVEVDVAPEKPSPASVAVDATSVAEVATTCEKPTPASTGADANRPPSSL